MLREILSAQKEGNELQQQVLKALKSTKSEKRKVSSEASSSEPEKKKTKKSETCSDDHNEELCIIYEGSTKSKILVRKELLRGPVLKAAISNNFKEESSFVLPSDELKLSNIPKSMKQLKKFFHREQLDKCNEVLKRDLTRLAEYLVLPELKLELLKLQICEFPSPTSKKIHLVSKVAEICKPLYEILIELETEDMIPVLKSFHNFLSENKAFNFFKTCTDIYQQQGNESNAELKSLVSIIYNDGTLDGMIYNLLKICKEHRNEYKMDHGEKEKFLKDAIKDSMWKKRTNDI